MIPHYESSIYRTSYRYRTSSRAHPSGSASGLWGILPPSEDLGRAIRALRAEKGDGGYVALERLDIYEHGYSVSEVVAFAGDRELMRSHGIMPQGVDIDDPGELEVDQMLSAPDADEAIDGYIRDGWSVVRRDDSDAFLIDGRGAAITIAIGPSGCTSDIAIHLPGAAR